MNCFICKKRIKQNDVIGTVIYCLNEPIRQIEYCNQHTKKEAVEYLEKHLVIK